jgi:phage terminase small subunit
MPALQNPRHERYAQLIVEGLNHGDPKPYSQSRAYIAAGYTAKDVGKRSGSAQAASSRLLFRVIQRVRELQHIAARNAAETAEKMARELNEIQYEARADKAHAAAVAAILGKAKILGIVDKPQSERIDWNTTTSMQDIGCKLLQSVGFASPDHVSIQAAIEANDVFIARLEAIRDRAQTLTIE